MPGSVSEHFIKINIFIPKLATYIKPTMTQLYQANELGNLINYYNQFLTYIIVRYSIEGAPIIKTEKKLMGKSLDFTLSSFMY